jgi:hypothetical protein
MARSSFAIFEDHNHRMREALVMIARERAGCVIRS